MKYVRLIATLCVLLLACGGTATANAYLPPESTRAPESPPTLPAELAPFVAGVRPAFAADIAAQAAIPRYELQLWIDPTARRVTGTMTIAYHNRTSTVLHDLALRLYPNAPRDQFGHGGTTRLDVQSAAINGTAVTARYTAQRTAVLLPLDPPLAPDGWTNVEVGYSATIKPEVDGSWPLPSYYPMLAVRDGDHWRLDVTNFPDKVFAESAFYRATVTAPSALTVVATGSRTASQPNADSTSSHTFVSGPVREWALTVGNFRSATANAGEVPVHVYVARRSSLDAQQIATVSAAALNVYERRFGPYPYRELNLHLMPGPFDGGDEFPGLILMTSDGQVDAGTRYVAAHEVAHQWWYGVVGDDIFRQPWLDEAFAQYSAIIYDEDSAGNAVAQSDWQREVVRRYRGALADGDLPVGRAITQYPNFNVYYRTVYGKGAVFLKTLRQQVGDDAFFAALQQYYGQHRYGVATTVDVQHAFESTSGHDLAALFKAWILP